MVCITYMKFVAQLSELKVAETYIKAIEIIKLNEHTRMLEELMDQWPFLINDVLLHHNPNDVWEWEKWVALWANNDDKVWFVSLVVRVQPCVSNSALLRHFSDASPKLFRVL